MSTTTPKKPLAASTMSSGTSGRRQRDTQARSTSPSARGSSPARVLTSNGTARNPSVKSPSGVARPNRASVRRPGSIVGSIGNIGAFGADENVKEEDARVENATLVDNLKKSLRNAELMSEDYQKQMEMMQKKMDDLMKEHARVEEQLHESTEKIEELEVRKREDSRQVREMANLYESERHAMMRDREEATTREGELKATIQRLRETMAGREMRFNFAMDPERRLSRQGRPGSTSRSSSVDENAQFAPPSSMQRRGSSVNRSDSKSNSRLVMQKDQMIESLRLELAEAQIKLVEMENRGGDRVQELEKTLLETRMTNARLLEDNESFQLLLGEKTLNGDFSKADFLQGSNSNGTTGLGSLAEELESAEGESENYRRLEAETKSLRDQNKALTLYIEKIISRVLQHENFETILDQKPDIFGPQGVKPQKELPPTPAKDPQPTVLQRAMSVVGPRRPRPQSQLITSSQFSHEDSPPRRSSRPQSQIFASNPIHIPSVTENPDTAPSIPLGRAQSVSQRRGHQRTLSEKSNEIGTGSAAAVVNQMYRGPSNSGGPISPISPGTTTPRTAYFGGPPAIASSNSNPNSNRPNSGGRNASGLRSSHGPTNSSDSNMSRESGEVPSPPRNNAGNTVYTGAVMTQHKLRPLRLVQQTESGIRSAGADDEAAKKRANRGSWMGWFNRGKDEPTPRSVSDGQGL